MEQVFTGSSGLALCKTPVLQMQYVSARPCMGIQLKKQNKKHVIQREVNTFHDSIIKTNCILHE